MHAGVTLLMIVSLVAADTGSSSSGRSTVLSAAAGADASPYSDNSYTEITDLPPAPARRVIRAVPRTEMLRAEMSLPELPLLETAQLEPRTYDIAPIGATSPIIREPMTTSTIMPTSASVVLQPVEPANTRPYLPPSNLSSSTTIVPGQTYTVPTNYGCPNTVATPTYSNSASYPATTYPSVSYPAASYSPVVYPSNVTYAPPVSPPAPRNVTTTTSTAPANSDLIVGRGLLGQPKLYIDGQPLRNALRWLTP